MSDNAPQGSAQVVDGNVMAAYVLASSAFRARSPRFR